MVHSIFLNFKTSIANLWILIGLCIVFSGLTGCAASYGKLQNDPNVLHSFQNNQPPAGYKYYRYGHNNRYYALAGIDAEYLMESMMWSEIKPGSDEFKTAVKWIYDDYAFTQSEVFGANILDGAGNKIGVWYSSIRSVAVKFEEGNRISLIPDTPWMRGPEVGGDGGGFRLGYERHPLYFSNYR